jgi:transcriptional regulator with XRE-family HTH domain
MKNGNQPIFFSDKRLRALRKLNQEDLAHQLGLKRSKVNSYENRVALNPPLEDLLKFSDLFKMSIDTLLKVDLSRLNELQIRELQAGNDVYIKGGTLRILATTITADNIENIELVNYKAKAGYTAGYKDPEYISELPTFTLPFLSEDRKYRTFQLDGDSMLPIPSGAYIIGEYLRDWHDIKDGHAYVILTKNDGIVFKVVYNQIRKKQVVSQFEL